jgi:predicted patatin/cPLA2 family phospholipase
LLGLEAAMPAFKDDVKHIIASSGNTANGAAFITGQLERAVHVWTEVIPTKEFLTRVPPRMDLSLLVDGVLGNTLDFPTLLTSPTKLSIGATDLATLEPVYFSNKDRGADKHYLLKALFASMSAPFYSSGRIQVGDLSCSDGELTATTGVNAEKAITEGATRVLVVYNASERYGWVMENYLRLTNTPLYRRIMRSDKRISPFSKGGVHVDVIRPSKNLPIRNMVDNKRNRIIASIDLGYHDGYAFGRERMLREEIDGAQERDTRNAYAAPCAINASTPSF